MSRKVYALASLLCALATQAAIGSPPELTLPLSVVGKPGEFIAVRSMTAGKKVAWCSLDPGLNLFPVDLLKDTHTAVVTCAKPGTYRILAITAAGDELSKPVVCVVKIQSPSPPAVATAQPAVQAPAQYVIPTVCGPNGCSVCGPNGCSVTYPLRRFQR